MQPLCWSSFLSLNDVTITYCAMSLKFQIYSIYSPIKQLLILPAINSLSVVISPFILSDSIIVSWKFCPQVNYSHYDIPSIFYIIAIFCKLSRIIATFRSNIDRLEFVSFCKKNCFLVNGFGFEGTYGGIILEPSGIP